MLLYIHIPFCDSKCHYCAFNSYTYLHNYKQSYMEALKKQLETELKKAKKIIETVFIGGGTPSTICFSDYKGVFEIIEKYKQKECEITIEANPNSASKEWLKGMFDLGVNRVSFGVQSFDDKKLEFLGRNHNKIQAIEAINNAKKIGYEHINCDIIYDTSMDSKELLANDLKIVETLPIDHISAYSLTIEEGTKFYDRSSVRVEDVDNAKYLFDTLENMGFEQYEISNFAKGENARSKHNLGYWEYKEYLGIGSGAVGCIDNKRLYNESDVIKYIEDPLEYSDIEELSSEDIVIEKVLLGLRSIAGFDMDILNDKQLEKLNELELHDKLFIKENRVYTKDFLLADELALYIEG